MSVAVVIKNEDIKVFDRGSGIRTWPLVIHHQITEARFTTGMSAYPKGQGAPMHWHNCDEQVTLLEGVGEVEIDGVITPLKPYDSTYISAGLKHCFRNKGDQPMKILWIYSSTKVTRTFEGSNEEVEHLSPADLMGSATDPGAPP